MLAGQKVVVFSSVRGAFGPCSRRHDLLQVQARARGWAVHDWITSLTDVFVTDTPDSGFYFQWRAARLNVRMVSREAFSQMLRTGDPDDSQHNTRC